MEPILHDSVDRTELDRLLNTPADWYLSMYLPMAKAGPEKRQNPIRYKNLMKQALEHIPDPQVKEVLTSLEPEHEFWMTQQEGLAILGTSAQLHLYVLPVSLPELVQVGPQFVLRPLLPYLQDNGSFLVLTIEKKNIHLWLGSHYNALEEIPLPDTPTSFEDYLKAFNIVAEVQFRGGHFGASGNQAMFHGHGDVTTQEQAEVKKFLHQFDSSLAPLLNEYRLPLVVVGVEDILPVYLEVNSYPDIVLPGIDVQPESLTPSQLRQRAWELVQPHYQQAESKSRRELNRWAHTDQVSNDLGAIIQAAFQGKIETLLVELDAQRWGQFDPDTNRVEFHSEPQTGSENLIETAVQWTLKRGGEVYLGTESMAHAATALLRY